MIHLCLVTLGLMLSTAYAEVGKVSRVIGSQDAYVMRQAEKLILFPDFLMEEGDEVFTQDSVVVIHLYPQSQMSLSKNTQIRITKNVIDISSEQEKVFSILDYVKGIVRLQITKDANQQIEQKVQAEGVAFAVRGTEFEVSRENEDFDLDVVEGEVEVTSPFVHTFVPEIVKANEGFRFNKRARKYQRRKFRMNLKETGFSSRSELRAKWKLKRQQRRAQGLKKGPKVDKAERQAQRLERKTKREKKKNK